MTVFSDNSEGTGDAFVRDAFETHRAFVFSRALSITKNFHDAEDVAQEAWARIVRSISGFEGRSSLKTWLAAVVQNTALNARRRRGSRPEIEFEGASQEVEADAGLAHPAERVDGTGDFRCGISALNEREREAFLLWHYAGRSFGEIGQRLGTSAQNARLIVWRATGRFRAQLECVGSSQGVRTKTG